MYAWEFQALNTIAEKNGWHKFISMQDYHSLLHREEEREVLPFCRSAGIGLIPWSPLARGLLARHYRESPETQTTRQTTDYYADMLIGPVTETDIAIINRVEVLAKKKNCSMAQISIAWSLKKEFNPIVRISRLERVNEAVQAVTLANEGLLTDEDVPFLDELYIPKALLVSGWSLATLGVGSLLVKEVNCLITLVEQCTRVSPAISEDRMALDKVPGVVMVQRNVIGDIMICHNCTS